MIYWSGTDYSGFIYLIENTSSTHQRLKVAMPCIIHDPLIYGAREGFEFNIYNYLSARLKTS